MSATASENQSERDLALVTQAVESLGEHFDSVEIFVSSHRPDLGGSRALNRGCGNWYTRYGQITEWIVRENEREREHLRHPEE